MWPNAYWGGRFWAARYWSKLGAPEGEIIQRRPTDNPSGVGTRSADARMGGL